MLALAGIRSAAATRSRVTLDEALVVANEPGHDFVALDDALQALAKFDERKSQVIEMRFFGGLSVEETAAVLKVSPATVMGDWRLAKAWLKREMRGDRSHDPERWQRIEALYHQARAAAPADRAAFLAAACADDDAMRREVESLLAESDSDDGFLAEPAFAISAASIRRPGPDDDGR